MSKKTVSDKKPSLLPSLADARHRTVAKSNELIQKSRFSLTRLQNNMITYVISKVQPNDPPGKEYIVDLNEFYRLMRYRTTSYTAIKDLLREIASLRWWKDAEREGEDDILMAWFDIVHANEKSSSVTISFHRDVQPYITQLIEQRKNNGIYFTSYELQTPFLMRHYASQRLYELLLSYQYNNASWVFELGTGSAHDLHLRLSVKKDKKGRIVVPDGWRNYAIFERDVLKPAQEDINRYSDLTISYTPYKYDLSGKKYRRYTSIEFHMAKKSEAEQKQTESMIDQEYRKAQAYRYEQMSLFPEEKNITMQEVRSVEDDALETSHYPILAAEYPELNGMQIDSLAKLAFKMLVPGLLPLSRRELWLADYVGYYSDKIKATLSDTRTTLYRRLVDSIIKDYDGVALQIANRHAEEAEAEEKSQKEETIPPAADA